jgi:MinD superfamily P-loop ATPase
VDSEACIYCGRCAEVCEYHAVAVVGRKVLVFPELCHGCGSCALNCPVDAIREVLYVTGIICGLDQVCKPRASVDHPYGGKPAVSGQH